MADSAKLVKFIIKNKYDHSEDWDENFSRNPAIFIGTSGRFPVSLLYPKRLNSLVANTPRRGQRGSTVMIVVSDETKPDT